MAVTAAKQAMTPADSVTGDHLAALVCREEQIWEGKVLEELPEFHRHLADQDRLPPVARRTGRPATSKNASGMRLHRHHAAESDNRFRNARIGARCAIRLFPYKDERFYRVKWCSMCYVVRAAQSLCSPFGGREMTSKPSNSEVKQAIFKERQTLKAAADVFDDRDAVESKPLVNAPIPTRTWEQGYDALGR
ncbi:hypothetical protein [Paracoccus sp. MKU1]|uniref:hypothetical protein n=1 Tax=Paracoccus sp. MKU1 TaxID=1745182 RepID=UPI0013799AC6|nr:hypothetical protein [Paracoccus sp. MKU1]